MRPKFAIGQSVKILMGRFTGEIGIIHGVVSTIDSDFTYTIAMDNGYVGYYENELVLAGSNHMGELLQ